jgi:hypothetical protein
MPNLEKRCDLCSCLIDKHGWAGIGYLCDPCAKMLEQDYGAQYTCSCSGFICYGKEKKDGRHLATQKAILKARAELYCPQCGEKHQ